MNINLVYNSKIISTYHIIISIGDIFYMLYRGKKLKCTLWDKYIQDALNFIVENKNGAVIQIIQFAKVKEWRGN